MSHLETYYKHVPALLTPFFVQWNKAMKHVRISIEWNYAVTSHLFRYVNNAEKLKLLKCADRVSKIYTVATLFRNFHAGFNGCQSSKYFGLVMPLDMVVKYIRGEDIEWD